MESKLHKVGILAFPQTKRCLQISLHHLYFLDLGNDGLVDLLLRLFLVFADDSVPLLRENGFFLLLFGLLGLKVSVVYLDHHVRNIQPH